MYINYFFFEDDPVVFRQRWSIFSIFESWSNRFQVSTMHRISKWMTLHKGKLLYSIVCIFFLWQEMRDTLTVTLLIQGDVHVQPPPPPPHAHTHTQNKNAKFTVFKTSYTAERLFVVYRSASHRWALIGWIAMKYSNKPIVKITPIILSSEEIW